MTRITRNAVVELLGTPDRTEGSLNSPVERAEHGLRFNEKWLYEQLRSDPAGVPMRAVYWHRYDFIGTTVRENAEADWRADTALEAALSAISNRMPEVGDQHRALEPNGRYRAVSEVKDARDLGGYVKLPDGGTIEEES